MKVLDVGRSEGDLQLDTIGVSEIETVFKERRRP